MNNFFKLYLLTRLDSIQLIATIIAALSFVAFGIYLLAMLTECYDKDDRKEFSDNYKLVRKTILWAGIVSMTVLMLVPTKQDAIMIYAGGKTIDFIQQDSSINKIPSQTTKIVSDFLQKQIDDVDSDKK